MDELQLNEGAEIWLNAFNEIGDSLNLIGGGFVAEFQPTLSIFVAVWRHQ